MKIYTKEIKPEQIRPGVKVHYITPHGAKQNGIIKSFNDDKTIVFVVYHCNEEWSNYKNYTGASTNVKDLRYGWVHVPSSQTFGSLMREHIKENEFSVESLLEISNLKDYHLNEILNDEVYINSIPIRCMERLVTTLRMSFEDIRECSVVTFNYLKRFEIENDIIKFPYTLLWENTESMDKYLTRLFELMEENI